MCSTGSRFARAWQYRQPEVPAGTVEAKPSTVTKFSLAVNNVDTSSEQALCA